MKQPLAKAQSAFVACIFALLLAGTNAVNPLLPLYRSELGMSPLTVSLTYVCYVGVLVVVLTVMARPWFGRAAPILLIASALAAIGSDVLIAGSSEPSILLGRSVAGVAVGIGTGAAAALVVAATGASGRALAATGNAAGAVVGSGGGQLTVELLGTEATAATPLGHAVLLATALIPCAVILCIRRRHNALQFQPSEGREKLSIRRSDIPFFLSGSLAWVAVSVGVVFFSTIFGELNLQLSRVFATSLMLLVSVTVQLLSTAFATRIPWLSGFATLAFGAACILLGMFCSLDVVALVGSAIFGAGLGLGYRTALVALTRGSTPGRQGALSSAFAAATYAISACSILLLGLLDATLGAVETTSVALAILALTSLAVLRIAPRLRDAVSKSSSISPQPETLVSGGAAERTGQAVGRPGENPAATSPNAP